MLQKEIKSKTRKDDIDLKKRVQRKIRRAYRWGSKNHVYQNFNNNRKYIFYFRYFKKKILKKRS